MLKSILSRYVNVGMCEDFKLRQQFRQLRKARSRRMANGQIPHRVKPKRSCFPIKIKKTFLVDDNFNLILIPVVMRCGCLTEFVEKGRPRTPGMF